MTPWTVGAWGLGPLALPGPPWGPLQDPPKKGPKKNDSRPEVLYFK